LHELNVYVDENKKLFLLDFGLSKELLNSIFSVKQKSLTYYRPPEFFLEKKLSYASDVYSMGK
jgi:serine/threonine protein kinase